MNRALVGRTYDGGRFEVTREHIERFARATGETLPAYFGERPVAPPVFGFLPVWQGVARINLDPDLGADLARIVHGEQRMTFARPIRAGDVLASTGRIESITERGANEVLVMRFDTHDESGAEVLTQDVVTVSRGTAAGTAAGAGRPPVSGGGDAATQAEPHLIRTFHLDGQITYRYADASGDHNLIHVDPELARKVGLPGIIVHGMCLLAIAIQGAVEEIAGGELEAVKGLGVRFSRPIQPGRDLVTRTWRSKDGARFESLGPDGQAVLRDGYLHITA